MSEFGSPSAEGEDPSWTDGNSEDDAATAAGSAAFHPDLGSEEATSNVARETPGDVAEPDLAGIFQGRLAQSMPGYEAREGQLRMARAVFDALSTEHVLLCEAGTGTGKTLAYLTAAILSGKKVVVSTASRALQEQIVNKDIPLIEKHLGLRPRVAVMKGLSNYLCLRRHRELASSAEASRPTLLRPLELVKSWREETESGDVSELTALGENAPILEHITSSSETRRGSQCEHFEECFVTRMKRRAEAAQLVIVNHHLFLADLALRGPHPARVIPDYDAVIFDEGHQLESIATDFFGVQISMARLNALIGETERTLKRLGLEGPLFDSGARHTKMIARAASDLFDRLDTAAEPGAERTALDPSVWTGEVQQAYFDLDAALEGLAAYCQTTLSKFESDGSSRSASRTGKTAGTGAAIDGLESCRSRCASLREQLAAIAGGARGNVTWLARSQRGRAVGLSPVDLGPVFRERLFESVPSAVLTSATLANATRRSAAPSPDAMGDQAERTPSGDFSFIRTRLGLTSGSFETRELLVPSPFDFPERALLYLPKDLPAFQETGSIDQQAARVVELLEVCDGGALVLTTSLRAMRAMHSALAAARLDRPLLVQGQAPKHSLLARMRTSTNTVLVATMSFWEGVDVPGRALRLVVLDKIPFPVPSDPVLQARSQQINDEGGQPFMELHLPLAQMTLKQGFGRLIRSREDWGVVALLDARVHRRGYGKRLLQALPPARQAWDLESVRQFFETKSAPGLEETAPSEDAPSEETAAE